jgi:hypothetical protein
MKSTIITVNRVLDDTVRCPAVEFHIEQVAHDPVRPFRCFLVQRTSLEDDDRGEVLRQHIIKLMPEQLEALMVFMAERLVAILPPRMPAAAPDDPVF